MKREHGVLILAALAALTVQLWVWPNPAAATTGVTLPFGRVQSLSLCSPTVKKLALSVQTQSCFSPHQISTIKKKKKFSRFLDFIPVLNVYIAVNANLFSFLSLSTLVLRRGRVARPIIMQIVASRASRDVLVHFTRAVCRGRDFALRAWPPAE